MNKQHKFQLISPIIGEKIYQTNSIKKGVQKCYDELKAYGLSNYKEFSVMDTQTYNKYRFAINQKDKIIQNGGHVKKSKNIFNDFVPNNIDKNNEQMIVKSNDDINIKINDMENNIYHLEEKIKLLEDKISNKLIQSSNNKLIDNKEISENNQSNLNKIENDSGCIIM